MTKYSDLNIYVAVVAVSLLIFCSDIVTPRGVAVWILYVIPVVMCIMQTRPEVPYLVALVQTILITIGYFVAPSSGANISVVISNRIFGVMVNFGIGFVVSRAITEHLLAQQALWIQKGKAEINKTILGEHGVAAVAGNMLKTVAAHVDAKVGRIYRVSEGMLTAIAAFGADRPPAAFPPFPVGQGLAGEAARQVRQSVASNLPTGYLDINSGLGRASPQHVLLSPITIEGHVYGVIELGFCGPRHSFRAELELLRLAAEPTGAALRAAQDREHLKELLEETQRQSEELQTQHEELRVTNEELEEQSRALRESQTRLESQQAELEATNTQLEEQADVLEQQKDELVRAKKWLERNADELGRANQYKSEFLANMSHELRTPLNSSLILSQILAENKSGTLTEEQVRYARTIQSSNKALLALINDILDLSKIEAGHMDIAAEQVSVDTILDTLRQLFNPVAAEKDVSFIAETAPDAPPTFTSDSRRLLQILKNLLSNAFKFTHKGEVALRVATAGPRRIAFSVHDTGVGIPEHQQQIIFEAFRQADGTTSRMYGGTGLGLSISRELSHLLDGEISVTSAPDRGSTFTLEISTELAAPPAPPEVSEGQDRQEAAAAYSHAPASAPAVAEAVHTAVPAPSPLDDDRRQRKRDRLILLIEDDPDFASVLRELAHERDFDCIHASTARDAIRLTQEYAPQGILLDINLPDRSGLSVLEHLKRDSAARHIPIHVVSLLDNMRAAFELGAVGYAMKPVAREELLDAIGRLEDKLQNRMRRLLIVEDNLAQRESLVAMLKADDIEIAVASTVAEALERISETTFDCVVTDLMLPDASGYELLEKLAEGEKYAFPPIIVYTGRNLSREEEQRLRRYSQSIIIKSAKSPARLLDEVTLFLHRVESSLPLAQQQLLLQARQRDAAFENRRILLVEDDVRNVFALTSILEPLGADVTIARNGREALDKLARSRDVDLVLMDLMMPEMDGLTATREIRKRTELSKLPIIALTAKAMPDDRKNCLDAGANDYIAKPIDIDKLVSLCRIWMPK